MKFTAPLPFDDALARVRNRVILPTTLDSRSISLLGNDVIARSVLSARTNSAAYLAKVEEVVEAGINGDFNDATLRAMLQDEHDALEYDPEQGGFAGEEAVEPAERGSLRDLSSNQRTQLLIDTQVRQAVNFAHHTAGLEADALWQYPCWELVRIYPREVPRGEKRVRGEIVDDPGNDWPSRWQKSGGEFFGGGRMIARKDDPVWEEIGSRRLFDDGLGQPYPPFAFNSGYGVVPVHRREAVALGAIGVDDYVPAQPSRSFNEGFELKADFKPGFLEELARGLDAEIADGLAKLRQTNPDSVLLRNRAHAILGVLDALLNNAAFEAKHPRGARGRFVKKGVRSAHAEIDRVMRQRGRYRGRLHVPGTGIVHLVYGQGGSWKGSPSHADGYGLSKIDAKHGRAALKRMPVVLLRGEASDWYVDRGVRKREFRLGREIAIVSQRPGKGQPIVLTSFDEDASELRKSDRRERWGNREGRLPERFWQTVNRPDMEDGNRVANPCPTNTGETCGAAGAVASKNFTIAPASRKVKR